MVMMLLRQICKFIMESSTFCISNKYTLAYYICIYVKFLHGTITAIREHTSKCKPHWNTCKNTIFLSLIWHRSGAIYYSSSANRWNYNIMFQIFIGLPFHFFVMRPWTARSSFQTRKQAPKHVPGHFVFHGPVFFTILKITFFGRSSSCTGSLFKALLLKNYTENLSKFEMYVKI